MGWEHRKESHGTPEVLEHLLDAVELIEFNNPPEYSYNPKGPWEFDRLVCAGVHHAFEGRTLSDLLQLKDWLTGSKDLVAGHFSYELKNLLEALSSSQQPIIDFPLFRFFIPKHVAILKDGAVSIYSHGELTRERSQQSERKQMGPIIGTKSKSEYIDFINRILQDIQNGEIYETNFCVEHSASGATIDPKQLFEELTQQSKAPFSCRLSHKGKHLICASPERFMVKMGNRVFSQPIKGTNRRTTENDAALQNLREDPKERAENIMITDLVRNDLSRSAAPGTMKVEELCGTYPFAHVNQMISTVSCELRPDVHPLDVLLSSFPMGSMTGAPKVRAMQLMEEYEGFSRGLFSGSVGYFTPELDFDFNVVIRSVLYDEEQGILSFPTGSAITINSDPEKEWEECQLKAESIRSILLQHVGKD